MTKKYISCNIRVDLKNAYMYAQVPYEGDHDKAWHDSPEILKQHIKDGTLPIKINGVIVPKELIAYIDVASDDSFYMDVTKMKGTTLEDGVYFEDFKEV